MDSKVQEMSWLPVCSLSYPVYSHWPDSEKAEDPVGNPRLRPELFAVLLNLTALRALCAPICVGRLSLPFRLLALIHTTCGPALHRAHSDGRSRCDFPSIPGGFHLDCNRVPSDCPHGACTSERKNLATQVHVRTYGKFLAKNILTSCCCHDFSLASGTRAVQLRFEEQYVCQNPSPDGLVSEEFDSSIKNLKCIVDRGVMVRVPRENNRTVRLF